MSFASPNFESDESTAPAGVYYEMNKSDESLKTSIENFLSDFSTNKYNLERIFADLEVQKICSEMIAEISDGSLNSILKMKWESKMETFKEKFRNYFKKNSIHLEISNQMRGSDRKGITVELDALTKNIFHETYTYFENLDTNLLTSKTLKQIIVSSSNKPKIIARNIFFHLWHLKR